MIERQEFIGIKLMAENKCLEKRLLALNERIIDWWASVQASCWPVAGEEESCKWIALHGQRMLFASSFHDSPSLTFASKQIARSHETTFGGNKWAFNTFIPLGNTQNNWHI